MVRVNAKIEVMVVVVVVVVVIFVWSASQCCSKRNVETQKILGQVGELIIARGRLEILNIVEISHLSCE